MYVWSEHPSDKTRQTMPIEKERGREGGRERGRRHDHQTPIRGNNNRYNNITCLVFPGTCTGIDELVQEIPSVKRACGSISYRSKGRRSAAKGSMSAIKKCKLLGRGYQAADQWKNISSGWGQSIRYIWKKRDPLVAMTYRQLCIILPDGHKIANDQLQCLCQTYMTLESQSWWLD